MPLFLVFGGVSSDNSTDIVSFLLAWEDCAISSRPLLFIPHLPLGVDGSNFLTDFQLFRLARLVLFRYEPSQLPYESLIGPESYAYMFVIA